MGHFQCSLTTGEMKHLESIIRSAMEAGEFDNLKGKGEPLNLDQSGRLAGEWQLAYHLLSCNGFSLPWIEERNGILEEIEHLRIRAAELSKPESGSDTTPWENSTTRDLSAAVVALRKQVSSLNQRIRDYNLVAPGIQFHICRLDAEKELSRLTT